MVMVVPLRALTNRSQTELALIACHRCAKIRILPAEKFPEDLAAIHVGIAVRGA